MAHGLELPGTTESATRARTAPSVRSKADNTWLHGKTSSDDLPSIKERAPDVIEGTPELRGVGFKDRSDVHIPNVTDDGGMDTADGGAKNGDGRQDQQARPASAERGETQSGRREEGAGTDGVMPLDAGEAECVEEVTGLHRSMNRLVSVRTRSRTMDGITVYRHIHYKIGNCQPLSTTLESVGLVKATDCRHVEK